MRRPSIKNLGQNPKFMKFRRDSKEVITVLLVILMIFLVLKIAPELTKITKNIVTYLYELDEEYITRFWIAFIGMTIVGTTILGKNKKD